MDLLLHGNLFVRCGAREMVFVFGSVIGSRRDAGCRLSDLALAPIRCCAAIFDSLYIAIAVSAFGFNCSELKDDK